MSYSKEAFAEFEKVVRETGTTLGVEYAFIAVRDFEDEDFFNTVAFFANGAMLDNFRYPAQGSPCDTIIVDHPCEYPHSVAGRFPEDEWLLDNGIEAYFGAPLLCTENKHRGHISIMSTSPIENGEHIVEHLFQQAAKIVSKI